MYRILSTFRFFNFHFDIQLTRKNMREDSSFTIENSILSNNISLILVHIIYFAYDRYGAAINGSTRQISSKRHYSFRERASAIASPSACSAIHYLIDCAIP